MTITAADPFNSPLDLAGLDPDLLLLMYQRMLEAREFEEQLYYLFLTTDMPGTMHQATGQEAVAIGAVFALDPADPVTSTHRGHAHCIAKGVSLDAMMAEMFASQAGTCHGMGGSLHLSDFSLGMLGAFGIVGAGIPIATGAALSAKVRSSEQVALCFLGDGAANTGVFHESLNMAALWQLPIVYLIENNQYALSMPVQHSSAVVDLSARACIYGMPSYKVDGNDVVAVYRAVREAAGQSRTGGGPSLIECLTYRIRGHARFEPGSYRPAEEVEAWKQRDPILRMRAGLLGAGLADQASLDAIQAEVNRAVEKAIHYARKSAPVNPDAFFDYVFS